MPASASAIDPAAAHLAGHWRSRLTEVGASAHGTPASLSLPRADEGGIPLAIAALAEFAGGCIRRQETLLLLVPDDEWLPEISNALDIELRPFCLVLPDADFAAAITLRATLSLLKSRLSRPAPDEHLACWAAQRQRLEAHAELWQATLGWSASGVLGGAWPARIDALFPVLILPVAQARALQLHEPVSPESGEPRDVLLAIHAERMLHELPLLRTAARRLLLLRDPLRAAGSTLARVDPGRRLRAELDMLVQELGDMELEFATAQAELAEFTRRYHDLVGRRLAELDLLQARIARHLARRAPADAAARHQARRAQSQAEQSRRENERFAELDREAEKPFAPSRDLKRLFRQLAQKIHPDRAENEADRAWRTELMSEANRAYRASDEMVLRDILAQWQAGPDTPIPPGGSASARGVAANPPTSDAATAALEREIQRVQRRIAAISAQLNRLLASKLYELFAAANLARNQGRDLLQEMAGQLTLQLEAARSRLAQLAAETGSTDSGDGAGNACATPPQR
ncbi:protein of unknown function [Sterolibacterium denitrificans]|uniref:Uncharacterized protein n=2 Tax=Sterolibacterium denitrificans TaxID=157592 RepID=A0A7Z7MW82_9PROT|nr:J domain-containing protein [Sterolibacterium denitrificans]KYC29448.1 hypothetical protein ACY05_02805 [Sterolibacterium denitrificans]SMB31609.1 protein of unknown function [Sterolibacterium denitrificans]